MSYNILSNLVITKIRSVSTLYNPGNTKGKRKDRKCWAILIKYEGETVYTYNEKKLLSDAYHLVALPKGCSYEWECTKSGHLYTIEFECDATYPEPIGISVKNSDKILKMFKELEYKRNLQTPTTEIESIRDTYSILIALTKSAPKQYVPNEKQKKIAPALEYISQNYNKSITNDELASVAGLSTVYFRKLFTDVCGVSPITYAHNLRIEKAKEMLKSDYGVLSDVAISLGYSSIYDFSRDFKNHVGVSPSKYENT